MKRISPGQKKFLAEFLGNFALVWLAGGVVNPFFSETLFTTHSWWNLIMGIFFALWFLGIAIYLLHNVK